MKIPSLQQRVLDLLGRPDYRPVSLVELTRALGLRSTDRPTLEKALDELAEEGRVVCNRNSRYGIPEQMDLVVGELTVHENGFGFVLPDQVGLPDVFVAARNLGGAMHRDRVMVRMEKRRGDKISGTVARILTRAHKHLVGVYQSRGSSYGFVTPSDVHLTQDVFIPKGHELDARNGRVVEVDLLEYPTENQGPVGKIVRVLGLPGDPGIDTEIILKEYGLRADFPGEVEKALKDIPDKVQAADLKRRKDLRNLPTFTIDPLAARDFDDAISIEKEGNGTALYVHIADVTHYIRPGDALDREAVKRGTSVYFPERVIPMLPEKVSNGLCSLKPNVDRLALTCKMSFDRSGTRGDSQVFASVIHSDFRLTYEQVGSFLGGGPIGVEGDTSWLGTKLKHLAKLAMSIRKIREHRGSLTMSIPETRIVLDDQGKMVDIRKEVSDLSHQVIEEAMIAANEAVAERALGKSLPFVYRIHEEPAAEKAETLKTVAGAIGLPMKSFSSTNPKAYQKILKHVEGRPEQMLVTIMLLRTLKQARYHPENSGHFGLASKAYSHFTSPIRRYPDLLIHRLLKHDLKFDRMPAAYMSELLATLEKHTLRCSQQERTAEEAERSLVAWKKAMFMSDRIGEEFDAVVSGVVAFGLFVEIQPYFVEGLVHISTLGNEYFHHDETGFMLQGRASGRVYRIGDPIKVRCNKVDEVRRRVEFQVVEGPGGEKKSNPGKTKSRPSPRSGRGRRGGKRRS